jgi:hypothetical protein
LAETTALPLEVAGKACRLASDHLDGHRRTGDLKDGRIGRREDPVEAGIAAFPDALFERFAGAQRSATPGSTHSISNSRLAPSSAVFPLAS